MAHFTFFTSKGRGYRKGGQGERERKWRERGREGGEGGEGKGRAGQVRGGDPVCIFKFSLE